MSKSCPRIISPTKRERYTYLPLEKISLLNAINIYSNLNIQQINACSIFYPCFQIGIENRETKEVREMLHTFLHNFGHNSSYGEL